MNPQMERDARLVGRVLSMVATVLEEHPDACWLVSGVAFDLLRADQTSRAWADVQRIAQGIDREIQREREAPELAQEQAL